MKTILSAARSGRTQQLAYYEHDMISLITSTKIYGVIQTSIVDMVRKVKNPQTTTPKTKTNKQQKTQKTESASIH